VVVVYGCMRRRRFLAELNCSALDPALVTEVEPAQMTSQCLFLAGPDALSDLSVWRFQARSSDPVKMHPSLRHFSYTYVCHLHGLGYNIPTLVHVRMTIVSIHKQVSTQSHLPCPWVVCAVRTLLGSGLGSRYMIVLTFLHVRSVL
jgi:hypothetical protein